MIEPHVAENYDLLIAERGVVAVRDFADKTGAADVVAWIDENYPADADIEVPDEAGVPVVRGPKRKRETAVLPPPDDTDAHVEQPVVGFETS